MIDNAKIIKEKLVEKLKAIAGDDCVFGYEVGTINKYPTVTIFSTAYSPVKASTHHDKEVFTFRIAIYQEMQSEATTPAQAEEIVDNLVNSIVHELEEDFTIDNTCINSIVTAQKGWSDREAINRAAIITLTAEVLQEI